MENDEDEEIEYNNPTHELFERHNDEFLKFERIPKCDLKHPRKDLCAFMYLHERFGGEGGAIAGAEHDQIWLDWDYELLTEEDVIYVLRCGVMYDSETDSLSMFA